MENLFISVVWLKCVLCMCVSECVCVWVLSHLVWAIRIERICYNNHSCSILPLNMGQHFSLRIKWALTLEIAFLRPYICACVFFVCRLCLYSCSVAGASESKHCVRMSNFVRSFVHFVRIEFGEKVKFD